MELVLALAITLLLAAFPFCVSVFKGRPDLLGAGTIFALGYSASYGLKGLLVAHDPVYVTYPDRYAGDEYMWPAFLCSWAGLIAFYVGLYGHPGRARPSCGFGSLLWLGARESRLARRFALAAIVLSAASMSWLVWTVSASPVDLLVSIEAWGRLRDDLMLAWVNPANKRLYYLPIWVGFFCLVVIALSPPKSTAVSFSTNTIAIALTLFTLVLLGGRAYLLSFVVGLLLLRHESIRRIPFAAQIGLLLSAAIVGGYLGIVQKSHTELGATAASMQFPQNVVFRLSSSYEQFETLANVLASDVEFDLGRSIAEDVLFTYAPRTIWPTKPTEFGYIRGQQVIFPDYWEAMGGSSTYPIGVLGELYFNFGYWGPIVGLWFMGWLLAHIRRSSARHGGAYIPIYCFLTASFLAPHRWFGAVLLTVVLLGGFFVAVRTIALVLAGSTSVARASAPETR